MKANNKERIMRLTGIGLLTAVVIVLQILGSFIRFGPFSISLVLIPIVVGTALYGYAAGGWLGFVFGLAVLLSGDAAAFLAVHIPGTVITVLAKGTLAGVVSGLVFRLLSKKTVFGATVAAAITCPIVNTGVFLLGCLSFFMPTIREWAVGFGFGDHVGTYMIVGLVGLNFIAEFVINIVLVPAIVQVIRIGQKKYSGGRGV